MYTCGYKLHIYTHIYMLDFFKAFILLSNKTHATFDGVNARHAYCVQKFHYTIILMNVLCMVLRRYSMFDFKII